MAKYLFEAEELTCVALEGELGLRRNGITSITIYPEGAVEIETQVALSVGNQEKLKQALAKRILPRGRKSEQKIL